VRLDAAFQAERHKRTHLCPLDLADSLPDLWFGPNNIRKFSATELDDIVDPVQLTRFNPNWKFDSQAFAKFSWLVVREEVAFNCEPGARALPIFYTDFSADLGRIDPYQAHFPSDVEAALVAVLLVPWEDWVEMAEVDWRAFRIPWSYTIDDDVFTRPVHPPSPDTLSWESQIYTDDEGEDVEVDSPVVLPLDIAVSDPSMWLNEQTWNDLCSAQKSPLFQAPISHFFIRAFATDGVDSFLAHIMVLEAALGLHDDHSSSKRRTLPGRGNPGATFRVATRLSALLGTKAAGENFHRLFDLRSSYLHGRQVDPISTEDRILARRLARQTIKALCKLALAEPMLQSRDDYLEDLLDAGLSLR